MGRKKGGHNKKRGPGRPKGSYGKKYKVKKGKGGKRGRPVGSKNRSYTESPTPTYTKMFAVPEGYIEPKSKKFLGYCKCGFIINTSDLVSKTIYLCQGCGKKNRISRLVKEIEKDDRPKSKKEYLEETVFSTKSIDIDVAPVIEEEIVEVEEVVDKKNAKDDEIK